MVITDIFIKRPVLSIVVSLLIVLSGLQAIRSLSVRQYPQSQNASVVISTVYVGADAELVKGFITTPIERAVAAADGIDYIKSSSALGLSKITARLKLNYDTNKALAEISSKVDQVRNDLPPEAEVPTINVENADSRASAYLNFTSDILKQNEITDYILRVVQPRFSSVEGVQRAEILSERIYAMRIWLKPEIMAALDVSPAEVRQALANNNVLTAVGRTKGSYIQANLTSNTDLSSTKDFRNLVVREEGGVLIRLEDIADVVFGAESYEVEAKFSGDTSVFMGIFPLPDANSLDVIRGIREELEDLKQNFPRGLSAGVGYDSTEYIDNALNDVVFTLAETLVIVILVIFLFMGSLRTALVPVVAIPLSLIGAVFLMQIFGFTINLLTLLSIVLAVGLVVDDAIVVVENIERLIQEGKKPFDAAIEGTRELVGPVIATTITLAAVYVPIGFAGGLTGSLFREFVFTLTGAVVISTIVALTLSPMLSSKILKEGMSESGFAKFVNRIFDGLRRRYAKLLGLSLRSRPAIYVFWIGTFIAIIPMYVLSPPELAPAEDQGVVFGIVSSAANATIDANSFHAQEVKDIFLNKEETQFTFQITNPQGGFSGAVFKPWDQRERTVHELEGILQAELSQVPGLNVFATKPAALPGGADFPVGFVITSTASHEQILEVMSALRLKAIQSGKFAFPPLIDLKIDQPQTEIVIDRDKVADLGLNLRQVSADLSSMLGGGFVNRFSLDGRSYKVIPQIKRDKRLNPEQLENIYVSGPNGTTIPLSTIATLENSTVPRDLPRFQQLNSATLQGVYKGPLSEALKFLETEAAKIAPDGFTFDYIGESRQLKQEGNKFLPIMMVAFALIFLVLAAQFNSFRDPLVILLGSVPLGLFGALIFTFLKIPSPQSLFWTDGWTTTMNIYSQVGLVTLVGLVAKNGILIVEFANLLQERGKSKLDAINEACQIRLRPILMTSVATVAGHFPLILVTGAGAAARNSIGLVLVGGMTIGTIFTLFVIPSVYMLLAKDLKNGDSPKETDQPITESVS